MPKKGQFKAGAKPRSVAARKYNSTPTEKKNRAARNMARRAAIKAGKVKKGDKTKDVDHIKPLSKGGSKKLSNTRVISSKKNRSAGGKMSRKKK